jgi:hypothetical protein
VSASVNATFVPTIQAILFRFMRSPPTVLG